ncbi:adenylate kinase family protein [Tardisphaera miroshnichenkoae]
MVFFLCGVPGTGKTTIARLLKSQYNVVELGDLIKQEGLYTSFDDETGSFVIDEERVKKRLESLSGDKSVIEWIDLSFANAEPDAAVVLRTNPLLLKKRLEERGYPAKKVRENVMAELLGVVHSNMAERWRERTFDVDTSTSQPSETAKLVISALEGHAKRKAIDWLSELRPDELDELIGQMDFSSASL